MYDDNHIGSGETSYRDPDFASATKLIRRQMNFMIKIDQE